MLAIRLQRRGRKGLAQYRVIVQDHRLTPTSGNVVYSLGNYDPHAKTATLDQEKAEFYLNHGAQPSNSVARLFQREGIKLPDWVEIEDKLEGKLKNAEKLRKDQPEEEVKEEAPAEETKEESEAEQKTEEVKEEPAAEPKAEEAKPEAEAEVEEKKAEEPKEAKESEEKAEKVQEESAE